MKYVVMDTSSIGLISVMFDRRISMHKQVIEDIIKLFGKRRILRGVRNNVRLAEVFNAGKTKQIFCAQKNWGDGLSSAAR
ncbi:hypothetical protein KFV02_08180 [Desulfohalobiaceae bacterium Ax17]|uniref:hypothetical protein n=1 Tax=Desulfovulcanus ferrireducens TaxID=2831190 RepID=UPI00207BB144|nr:hypothetical protein [Desulfovulcanus ferrireducens]MBT8763908.1 hypothetical protein [Desulfovulcanus ferrireducens]